MAVAVPCDGHDCLVENSPQAFLGSAPPSTLRPDGRDARANRAIVRKVTAAGVEFREQRCAAIVVAGFGAGRFMAVGVPLQRAAPGMVGCGLEDSTKSAAHSSVFTPNFISVTLQ